MEQTKTQNTNDDDFSSYMLADTSVVEIDLPNGEPMIHKGQQVRVHVYGPSTPQHAKAQADADKEATRRVLATLGNKSAKRQKAEEDVEVNARFLVAVTDRIEGFPYPGGVDAIYRNPKLRYIGEQVRAHLADLGNFFGTGAKS